MIRCLKNRFPTEEDLPKCYVHYGHDKTKFKPCKQNPILCKHSIVFQDEIGWVRNDLDELYTYISEVFNEV
jgi:hypothetical protein